MTRKQKLVVFGVLLAVLIAMTLVFASGLLRFGLSGPSVYVLYVIAGLLASVLTFGLLTSSGTLIAKRHGASLTLGGAIVALVVVAGGGGLYEKYLHQPQSFDALLVFWINDPSTLARLDGEVVLYAGNNDFSQQLIGTGRARYLGLPTSLLGQAVSISLDSPGYQVVDIDPSVFSQDEPIRVEVQRAQRYATPNTDLNVVLTEAQVVDFGPRPDQRIITLTLRIHSDAQLPLPLDNTAQLRIFTESGGHMWEAELDATGSIVLAEPGLSTVTFEAQIDRNLYDSLGSGRLAELVLHYDKGVGLGENTYSTGQFFMSRETLHDHSDPH